jgi:hypothetical protein
LRAGRGGGRAWNSGAVLEGLAAAAIEAGRAVAGIGHPEEAFAEEGHASRIDQGGVRDRRHARDVRDQVGLREGDDVDRAKGAGGRRSKDRQPDAPKQHCTGKILASKVHFTLLPVEIV